MGASGHPVADRLQRPVEGDAALLATVMGLPLVDGLFPALVLTGALDTPAGVVGTGLLVFGGSATAAVVLTEMDGPARNRARSVLLVGAGLVVLAAVEAALAPTLSSAVDLATFERFAAVVVAAVAAKTASARIGEALPRPGVVVALGLVASVEPAGATVAFVPDPGLVARSVAAAGVGVAFALVVALGAPRLRSVVDVDRFRFGSAVALGLFPLSLLGLPFGHAPLAVLALTAAFSFDPGADGGAETASDAEDRGAGEASADSPAGRTNGTRVAPARSDGRAPWL